jgi:hypothetical protein
MLIYELFLKNKDVEDEVMGDAIPCKKVYAKRVNDGFFVELDQMSIDEYGKKVLPEAEKLQVLLNLPLMNQMTVGLPNHATGSNSKPPYISLYGILKGKKLEISIKGRQPDASKGTMSISFDLTSAEVTANVAPALTLRIDDSKYFIGDTPLFNEYVSSGIIDGEGGFSGKLFESVGKSIIDYCKARHLSDEFKNNKQTISFRLVLLPFSLKDNNAAIVYKSESENQTGNGIINAETSRRDAFDFPMDAYASTPIIDKYSKFISYDDQAFTINCNQAESFYETLGVGKKTLEKIKMPTDYPISGLFWYFIPLFDTMDFQKISGGIYAQLKQIYAELTMGKKSVYDRAELKIICSKKTQAKIEILLDENLTVNQLAENFKLGSEFSASSPLMALEDVFLLKNSRGEVVDWAPYISAIRSCISGVGFEKERLLALFTRQVRGKLFEWIGAMPNCYEASAFFKKADFCMNLLITKNNGEIIMDPNEEYAYRIGKIAGEYLNYKRTARETSNSLYDIMTYTKYDRERLRFVYQKISIGIFLSKKLDTQGQGLVQTIADLMPKDEIDDAKSDADFSYFFYKGLFEKLRGV